MKKGWCIFAALHPGMVTTVTGCVIVVILMKTLGGQSAKERTWVFPFGVVNLAKDLRAS